MALLQVPPRAWPRPESDVCLIYDNSGNPRLLLLRIRNAKAWEREVRRALRETDTRKAAIERLGISRTLFYAWARELEIPLGKYERRTQ